jgi:hypothetical protein
MGLQVMDISDSQRLPQVPVLRLRAGKVKIQRDQEYLACEFYFAED